MTDTLLLANLFESFRSTCINAYGLDPAHFYTALGMTLQAALKFTNIELELLSDVDMLLIFEHGIRDLVQVVHHHAEANNKYMKSNYNPNLPSIYLQYLDANNLYGWEMSHPLPAGGFHWVHDVDSFTCEKINDLVLHNKSGYLFEVDVDYPHDLHDKHNDLPFMAESMNINGVNKLVSSLSNKRQYVIHISALDQALSDGLILCKVHKVIKFDQSMWLEPYIHSNTVSRSRAHNDFEKHFFKLMNNIVFSKTMENIRKHKDIKLVTTLK